MKSRLVLAVKIGVSLVTLAIVARSLSGEYVRRLFSSVQLLMLGMLNLLALGLFTLRALKLRIIIGRRARSFRRLLHITFISEFFSNIMSGGAIGETMRALLLKPVAGSIAAAARAVLTDRISGILMQVVFMAWGITHMHLAPTMPGSPVLRILVEAPVILGIGFGIFYSVMRFGTAIIRRCIPAGLAQRTGITAMEPADSHAPHSLRGLLCVWILSGVFYSFVVGMVMYVSRRFNAPISVFEAAGLLLAGTITSLLPIAAGGWGLTEGMYVLLYGLFSLHREIGFAVALVMRLARIIPSAIGWILFMKHRHLLQPPSSIT